MTALLELWDPGWRQDLSGFSDAGTLTGSYSSGRQGGVLGSIPDTGVSLLGSGLGTASCKLCALEQVASPLGASVSPHINQRLT